jgi:hypothetical protein
VLEPCRQTGRKPKLDVNLISRYEGCMREPQSGTQVVHFHKAVGRSGAAPNRASLRSEHSK